MPYTRVADVPVALRAAVLVRLRGADAGQALHLTRFRFDLAPDVGEFLCDSARGLDGIPDRVCDTLDRVKQRRIKHALREILWAGIGAVGLTLVIFIGLVIDSGLKADALRGFAPALAGLLAAALATLGWMANSWSTYRHYQHKQTIDFINDFLKNQDFRRAKADFDRFMPVETDAEPIDTARYLALRVSGQESERAAFEAVKYLLNYFEFVAVAIFKSDFDADLIDETFSPYMVHYFERCRTFIAQRAAADPDFLAFYRLAYLCLRTP